MSKQYVKGKRAEQYITSKLKSLGATSVTRSSRSLGDADLIAVFLDEKEIWFIQVKSSKKGLDPRKVEREYGGLKLLEGLYRVRGGVFVKTKKGWVHTFV